MEIDLDLDPVTGVYYATWDRPTQDLCKLKARATAYADGGRPNADPIVDERA